MGRKASIQETVPHPSPRFRENVRLHRFRRGPTDDIWCATFRLDGKWQTRRPINLGTRDMAEAAEVARDKFTLATSGQAVTRAYKTPAPPPSKVDYPLKLYAERAIAKLRKEAEEAKSVATGKAHNALALVQRIEKVWVSHWGDSDITKLTENELNDWLADTYRVMDRAATASSKKPIFKKPSRTTIGNLDWALRHIWQEAVADRVVDRRSRPILNKGLGEGGDARPFIDAFGVQAVAQVMTEEWAAKKHKRERPGVRRMLRTYIAMIASTGIRAGLEAKRVLIGNVHFLMQHNRPVILIDVVARQGKHPEPRSVIVYEGDPAFDVRSLLIEHIAWRRSQGASNRDYLFAWPDGSLPDFDSVLKTVLKQANALTDPMTGESRVAYSFRHYFATRLVELGLSVAQIAEWLGTSSMMVERHYNRFLTARSAHLLNGGKERWHRTLAQMPTKVEPWETEADVAEYLAGPNGSVA